MPFLPKLTVDGPVLWRIRREAHEQLWCSVSDFAGEFTLTVNNLGFLAQMYARFSPQQVVHAGGRGCGCARGRYSAGKSSVAQSTAACAAPLLVGGLLGGSQLDRKVLRRWHLQGDEP